MLRHFCIGLLAMIASSQEGISSAFSPTGPPFQRLPSAARTMAVDVAMSSEVNRRRNLFVNAAVIAVAVWIAPPSASFALNTIPADNEIVKEQRTVVAKIDINNAPVADYMQLPGMYPTIGGKIANNGPYHSIRDVYKLKLLSKAEKSAIKKYESKLTTTAYTGLDTMRGRDPYRRSFNK